MNIRRFLWIVIVMVLLPVSCDFREDEIFGRASSLRNQDYREHLREILMAPDSGWYFYNYDDDEHHFCGMPMCCSFDSAQVFAQVAVSNWGYIQHEYAGIRKGTGLYSITNQNNVLLSFSTLNPVAHSFKDFEFVIKSVSAEVIVMEGMRNGYTYYMHPMSSSPEEMIRNAFLMDRDIYLRQASNHGTGRDLIGTVSGEEIELHLAARAHAYVWWRNAHEPGWEVILYLKSRDAIVDRSIYAFTDKGIELLNDFTVGDVSFSRITLDFPQRKATLCDRFDNEVGSLTISDDIQCTYRSPYAEPGYVPWDPDYFRNL